MENQLGTQLFIRHSRSVVLTHAGKILMEESRRLLVNANNVLARIERNGRGEAGRIELGVVGTAMWGRMRPVMRRFLRENPNVDVLFSEKMPAMQMALLERRELDAGIWRMATEPPTGFTSLRLHDRRFWWRCLKSIISHHFPPSRWKRYVTSILLQCRPFTLTGIFCSEFASRWDFHRLLIREVNEPQTVLAMVSMGIGVTLIADSYAQMNWPGVIFRPLKQRIPADLYIVYETQQVTPAMVKLLAALTQ
ncbi:LysR family transcriptional regulator [Escherichia coli]